MQILSEPWCLRATEAASGAAPELIDTTIEVQMAAAPRGLGRLGVVIADGRITSLATGRRDDADIVVKMKWNDCLSVLRGELDPAVAFMRGDLKAEGPTGPLLAILSSWHRVLASESYRALLSDTDRIDRDD